MYIRGRSAASQGCAFCEHVVPLLFGGEQGEEDKTSQKSCAAVSPEWSSVVKQGSRLKHVTGNATIEYKPSLSPPKGEKTRSIIGNSTEGNIEVIKLVNVSLESLWGGGFFGIKNIH